MLNNGKINLRKIDSIFDEEIFLGHSNIGRAYRVFTTRNLFVEESFNVVFN